MHIFFLTRTGHLCLLSSVWLRSDLRGSWFGAKHHVKRRHSGGILLELSASVMSLRSVPGIKLDFGKFSEATGVVVALCVRVHARACVGTWVRVGGAH